MKSTLRSRIAAAALLLSPAAAFVAQPAHAQLADALPALIAQVIVNDAYGRDSVYQRGYDRSHERGYEGQRSGWRRDERAPDIMQLTPLPGDRTGGRNRTTVSARFIDKRSGVDPQSVRLRVDGRDVTHASRIDADEIRFRDELAPGRHVAEVIVRDRAGNTARRSWQFEVAGHDRRGHGYGYGRDGQRGWDR